MSDFSGSSMFDQTVEKATPDSSGEENWGLIAEIYDKAGQSSNNAKDCLKSVMKRLGHSSKNVQLHTITLLDSCVLNSGVAFHKEVATPEFVKEARSFLSKASPNAADKFKESLQKWAENEFKSDSNLSVIPTFYQALRSEGAYFGMSKPSSQTSSKPASSSTVPNNADADLAAAIALSLKESQNSKAQTSSLYPQMSNLGSQSTNSAGASTNYASMPTQPQVTGRQVRALYDFEAVEENELTFKTGDLITVLDDSDPNWWKGSTWRGEGLFPVNFVTTDLSLDTSSDGAAATDKKSVQFNEEVQVEQFDPESVQIDESVIDQALDQIQNADPTGLTDDSPEMLHLEEECKVMGPLIDQELEQIDTKHNELMNLNQKLTDAFQLYTRLMKESSSVPQYASTGVPGGYPTQQMSSTMPANYLPSQPQTLPAGVGASNMYTSYNPHAETAQQPQTYYTPGAYGGQPQPVMNVPVSQDQQQQLPQQQYTQAALLQQYQMGGAGMSSIQYMPSVTDPSAEAMPMGYNGATSQYTNYHQQMQPPQHLS